MKFAAKLFSRVRLLGILLGLLGSDYCVRAALDATLAWDPSPENNVAGYVLYNGIVNGGCIGRQDVGNRTTATVTNLLGGITNFFFVTAYDVAGFESAPSDMVVTNFPGTYFPPTIPPIPDQVIGENLSAGPISFTIGDALFPADCRSLSATSSNPTLVPDGNILFGGRDTNRNVMVVPATNQSGSAIITITVADPIASASRSFRVTVDPAVSANFVYLTFEAESGILVPPMAALSDPKASKGRFIASPKFGLGSASFTVNIPVSGVYRTWCRVLSLRQVHDNGSFVVSADTGAVDIFDASPYTWQDEWRWLLVDGPGGYNIAESDGSPAYQSVFPFEAGQHAVSISTLEANIRVDQVLLTNDRDYIPTPPVLTVPADQTINELATLVLTNSATPDTPPDTLTFRVASAPAGVSVDSNTGILTWTPTEAQGPSTNLITVEVTDDRVPSLSDIESFRVIVWEVNRGPVLTALSNRSVDELSLLVVTNTATDPDIPGNTLTYSLVRAPDGVVIDSKSGVLTWRPTEAEGPSTNLITVQVTDNGTPPRSDTKSFTVVVNEVNSPPFLLAPPNRRINELYTMIVTLKSTDPDLPANTLKFSLDSAPAGVTLEPNTGVLIWTPTETQGPSTNLITVRVTDDGTPPRSDTRSFAVVVNEVNSAPVLGVPSDLVINELTTLVVANAAADADVPANSLTFSLVSAPTGATVNTNTGVFTWTPTEAQGPSTNLIFVQVTDDGSPSLSTIRSFTIRVNEVNSGPRLVPVPPQTIRPGSLLMITNTALDADIPPNLLTFSLGPGAPVNAMIDAANGVFTWRPTAAQADTTNTVTVWVADDGSPRLSDWITFTVITGKLSPVTLSSATVYRPAFYLRATGDAGITYGLEASTDLVSWDPVMSVNPPSDEFDLMDTNALAFPFRYYRVTVAP